MKAVIISFVAVAIAFVPLIYTLLKREYRKYYVPAKMFNSAVFIVNLSVMSVISGNREAFTYLMPGFFLCFVGDLFMGLHNKYVKKRYLLLGTLLFLLGHVCFISYLYTLSGFTPYDLILPVLGVIGVLVLKRIPSFFLGKFAYAGMIYAIFVCTMAGKSIQVLWVNPGSKGLCLALGGIFFLTSDVLIAPLYFKKKRAWAVHGLNIGTYYLAMFFIAVSVLF
ncbi:MAG: hypothetical protein IKY04_02610 [Lachnospiraceae bacterium]|nr:hypothetical protein [Lachnospiraceae bacterium]